MSSPTDRNAWRGATLFYEVAKSVFTSGARKKRIAARFEGCNLSTWKALLSYANIIERGTFQDELSSFLPPSLYLFIINISTIAWQVQIIMSFNNFQISFPCRVFRSQICPLVAFSVMLGPR